MRPILINRIFPQVVSNRAVATNTVIKTPDMSMMTCIVVLECAGSIWKYFNMRGRIAPTTIEERTIKNNANVMAMVSEMEVSEEVNARKRPTKLNKQDMDMAIMSSRRSTRRTVLSLRVPTAIPRMILTLDWFPAFPPAPTSIVKKKMMEGWD